MAANLGRCQGCVIPANRGVLPVADWPAKIADMAVSLPPELQAALRRIERRPSRSESLATALLPLAGVLLFDWPVAAVIGIYWLDNVLVGAFHLFKMFSAQGRMLDPKYEASIRGHADWSDERKDELVRNAQAVQHHVLPWFFLVHYGLFCAGHGTFVAFLFDGAFADFGSLIGLVAIAALLMQHALDLRAFRADDELVALPRALLMFQPYPRVIALHVALLFGMFPALFGYPEAAAVVLAAVRFWIDRSQVFATQTLLRRKS